MLFKDRAKRWATRNGLRLVGFGIVVLVLVVLAVPRDLAYAQILAPFQAAGVAIQHLAQSTEGMTVITPDTSPEPTGPVTPSPSPIPRGMRGGPLRFTISGSLSLGTQIRNSSNSGNILNPLASPSPSSSPLFPFQQSTTQSENESQASTGLLVELSRRSGTTLTDIKIPLGFGTGATSTQISTVQAIYSTPTYSIGYGSQGLLVFGQLPLGSTLRGFSFIVPIPNGQETVYEGPAIGSQGEIIHLLGVLAQEQLGNNYYEAGYTTATGTYTGDAKMLEFGAGTSRGNLGLVGEGAFQQRTDGDGSPHGLAFQLRMDDGPPDSGFEVTLRDIPDQFVAFGSGEINSDKYVDTSWHGGSTESILVDANWERTGNGVVGVATQHTETLTIGGPAKFGGFALGLQQQNTVDTGQGTTENQELSGVQAQIQTILATVQTTLGSQFTRSILDDTPSSTRLFSASVLRQFGTLGLNFILQSQRQTLGNSIPQTQTGGTGSISKQFGKATIGISDAITHTISSTSNAIQRTPLLNVSRQISPVISIQTSYGYQTLRDTINPSADGRSQVFSLQLNAPFSFGNGIATGRIDPRLPATIIGRVQVQSSASNPLTAGFATAGGTNGGLGNVVVVLDDRYTQRTDLTGGFQFSFIPPGQHQLRVETSSLPRGVTVSTPVVTTVAQGGQTVQVLFQVGNYGGVFGHVYGLDANGNKLPLSNVKLRIDGGTYSQTDTTGAYGFGGLNPGKHDVEVIENTIPAFATFDPTDLKKTVTVANGAYTTLDFNAQPLGSISGRILFGADVAKDGYKGGVLNAYVVAEPGEHAAIDEDDGSFIIDNLPPGDYTLSVDPETLPPGFGATPESVPVHLGPAEHNDGNLFTVGRFEKKVVFSFLSGTPEGGATTLDLSEKRLPPKGSTQITVTAPASAGSAVVTAFDEKIPLQYDKDRKAWLGEVEVPPETKAGDYPIAVALGVGVAPPAQTLTVDPKMPLVLVSMKPANPTTGQYVRVTARFLVDAHAGDRIEWEDGQTTVLGKPVSGRVFTFRLLISLRPLHGSLSTKHLTVPIVLM